MWLRRRDPASQNSCGFRKPAKKCVKDRIRTCAPEGIRFTKLAGERVNHSTTLTVDNTFRLPVHDTNSFEQTRQHIKIITSFIVPSTLVAHKYR
jgi:hypothetical protein